MRRKRPFAVIAFASTEQALAGCGLAWKAETSEEQVLLDALRETGIGFETHALVELFE